MMAGPSFAIAGQMLNGNAVFLLMPPLAQLAWLKLAAAMVQSGITVLRIRDNILTASQIAAFARLTEAEWESYAPILFRFGFLSIEDDGAIGCPPLLPRMRDLFGEVR